MTTDDRNEYWTVIDIQQPAFWLAGSPGCHSVDIELRQTTAGSREHTNPETHCGAGQLTPHLGFGSGVERLRLVADCGYYDTIILRRQDFLFVRLICNF